MITKTFLANKENLEAIQDFVFNAINNNVLTPKDKFQLNLVIEEIFVNIASYSYEEEGNVDVIIKEENNEMSLSFVDSGKPFNPLAKEDPDITLGAEERGIGGLGIFIVKKIMDDVIYKYENSKNILTLVKKY